MPFSLHIWAMAKQLEQLILNQVLQNVNTSKMFHQHHHHHRNEKILVDANHHLVSHFFLARNKNKTFSKIDFFSSFFVKILMKAIRSSLKSKRERFAVRQQYRPPVKKSMYGWAFRMHSHRLERCDFVIHVPLKSGPVF